MQQRRVLQVCAVGMTARFLLRPLLERLQAEGFCVEVACSPDEHAQALARGGQVVHAVPIRRSFLSLHHLRSIVALYRLMRREQYDIVHVHTPVAAVLGRLAARWARVPMIVYTAHGFYFHDNMTPWKRRVVVAIERWLGRRATDLLLTQSREDRDTAIREGIAGEQEVVWIGNGVDPGRFEDVRAETRREWGLRDTDVVIGYVGRFVREKGLPELLDALAILRETCPKVRLLLVGGRAQGDRDTANASDLSEMLVEHDLENTFVVTGFQYDVAPFYGLMDLFVLPSHREGMPRTILEAMASGLPVVASDIRGCREEVVHGETGYLFPVCDVRGLAERLEQLIMSADLRQAMGAKGKARCVIAFDEKDVLNRQLRAIEDHLMAASSARRTTRKRVGP